MDQSPKNKNQTLFVMKILWVAMLFSQFTMIGTLASSLAFKPEEISLENFMKTETIVFCVMALLNAVVGYLLPKFIVRHAARKFGAPDSEAAVLRLSFPAYIIRLAFTEAIVLFGFLVAQLLQNSAAIVPFTALSLFLFLFYFPNYQMFRSWTR